MRTRADSETTKPGRRPALPARRGWFQRLFADIFFVTKRDRKWWLLPLIILLLILAVITVIAALAGPLAPFVYPVL